MAGKRGIPIWCCLAWLCSAAAWGASPLEPVKTDHPQDTMRTFMEAMEVYRKAEKDGREARAENALNRAVRTLDLSKVAAVLRTDAGREAAIFLKEVIDRIVVINYNLIPPGGDQPVPTLWRLKGTEIRIGQIKEGERRGEYLFTPSTVRRARQFYQLVREMPYLKGTGGGAGYSAPWVESHVPPALRGKIFDVHNWQWIGLFIAIFLGLLAKRLIRIGANVIARLATRSRVKWDDMVLAAANRPIGWTMAATIWFLALKVLRFEGLLLSVLGTIVQLIFSGSVIWIFYKLTGVVTEYVRQMSGRTDFELDAQLVPLVNKALRIFVVIFGGLVTFQNLGINVMSLVAGLGLGGLAFALAAKDTAANLFGSMMILSDSPFRSGDWVKFGDVEGTVESVGFRSTRVRTFYNSLVAVPNAVVANETIDNMGRREFRRITATLGVTYDTPPEKLEAFLEGIKNIIKANPHTRKDYFHVVFSGYGDSALEIMLYFFFKVPDWSTELVQRQNVYLEILRLAAGLEIDFAFPTQSLHVESFPEKKGLQRHQDAEKNSAEALSNVARDYGSAGRHARPSGLGIFRPPHEEKSGGQGGQG